ncbi:MAG: hypothetical protein ABSH21_06840 [Verrucomicrobiia bacterium]|jgi:hypothetical protein
MNGLTAMTHHTIARCLLTLLAVLLLPAIGDTLRSQAAIPKAT